MHSTVAEIVGKNVGIYIPVALILARCTAVDMPLCCGMHAFLGLRNGNDKQRRKINWNTT